MAGFAILFVAAAALAAPMTVLAINNDVASIQEDQYYAPRNRKTLRRTLTEEAQQQQKQHQRSIGAIAEQTIALSTFQNALKESVQVLGTLNTYLGDAAVTALMPWNQAFDTLPDGFLERLMESDWILHRQNLLLYHIHIGNSLPYSSHPSTSSTTSTLSMANGETIVLNINNGNMQFENYANVVAYEEASNGYAYIIDKVLAPSFMSNTIMDIVTSSSSSSSLATPTSSTSTFATLIVTAGLENLLSHSRAAFTVFCPSNEAVAALGEATLAYLQSSDGAEMLQQIITYHIVSGVYASVNMITKEEGSNRITLRSLLDGSNLSIEMVDHDDMFTVDGVLVTMADTLAMNGIVHIIPKVLTPPSMWLTTTTKTTTTSGIPPV